MRIVQQILAAIEADIHADNELGAYQGCSDLHRAIRATGIEPHWNVCPEATKFFESVEEVNNALYRQ